MNSKKSIVSVFVILSATAVIFLLPIRHQLPQNQQISAITPQGNSSISASPTIITNKYSPCLADDEYAGFTAIIPKSQATGTPLFGWGPGIVSVVIGSSSNPGRTTNLFNLDTFQWNIGVSPDIHKCHIYVIQTTGRYDYENRKPFPGGMVSLWRYDYAGKGEKVLDFVQTDAKGNEIFNFWAYEFLVDPSETYVALIKGTVDTGDNALIIKNINTNRDVFTLTLNDFLKIYNISHPGQFDISGLLWTDKHLPVQLNNDIGTSFWLQKDTWKILEVFNARQ
jgi:hypothetical protein